ncbi:MAG: endonuclease [Myxococcota bacterium]
MTSNVEPAEELVEWERFLARTTPLPPPFAPEDPPRFGSRTDRLLREAYADRRRTLYCGCRFDEDKRVQPDECGFRPGPRWRNRAGRIEWEHIVPASRMLEGRRCARDPERDGSPRDWCRRVDPEFRAMEGDPHNLAPAIGQLNAERSNYPYGEVAGEPRRFGACDFEVENDVAEPPPRVRGDVARVHLYMTATYGLSLRREERELLFEWAESDPPDEDETALWNRLNEALAVQARWHR